MEKTYEFGLTVISDYSESDSSEFDVVVRSLSVEDAINEIKEIFGNNVVVKNIVIKGE